MIDREQAEHIARKYGCSLHLTGFVLPIDSAIDAIMEAVEKDRKSPERQKHAKKAKKRNE